MIRRRQIQVILAAVIITAGCMPALAADDDAATAAKAIAALGGGDRVDQAMDRGMKYLLSIQNDDGSICDVGQHKTAMTSLAILAMTGMGVQPGDQTAEGRAVNKALDYILDDARLVEWGHNKDGKPDYYGRKDNSRMYGHGITTLMLAEMLGMGSSEKQDRLIRERLQRSVDLILRAQKVKKSEKRFEGGWRYEPNSNDADLSVTVWQVMALRAAYNAGLDIPTDAINDAVTYINRSYDSPRNSKGQPTNLISGCSYQPGGNTTFSTAAEGLLSLQVCGQYDSLEVRGSSEWLLQHPAPRREKWLYYGTYYLAQGMYQREGKYAQWAHKAVPDSLLPKQESNGAWALGEDQEGRNGKVYTTSMAMLSLSIKYHFLPIYQR